MNQNQLFMLMEIVQGGELWTYIYEKVNLIRRTALGGFVEGAAMFYSGCVISAFHYVHDKGVAYRDLKVSILISPHETAGGALSLSLTHTHTMHTLHTM